MLNNIKNILKNKSYLTLGIFSIILMTYIFAIFTNLISGISINPVGSLLTIIMAILSGIYITVFLYSVREVNCGKPGKTGFAGILVGFFTSACPICAPLLVSLLGLSAPLAFILSKNLWLQIVSIAILSFALYKLSGSISKCECSLEKH